MKIIHTADWHLGQSLHDHPRAFEHGRFLAWLLDRIEDTAADALIIAGDVFDVVSPSSEAQEQYYGFLAACRQRFENLDVVVVGGNHDSAARLDAPRSLLGALNIRVVGGLPLRDDGSVDADRALVPITDANGEVTAYVLAVPFMRRRELPAARPADPRRGPPAIGPPLPQTHLRLIDGYRSLYRTLVDAGLARRTREQALVATGHLYMVDGQISERSERKIQVGYQYALPVDIFPDELAYVALGHLHRAQAVGGRPHVRYAGSPIPLSLAEHGYEHQVVLVELDGPRFARARPLFVPRSVDILRVPEEHRPLDEVRARLSALRHDRPRPPEGEDALRPLLEVRVLLEHAEPRLRTEIEEILEGAGVRLLRIDVQRVPEDGTTPVPRRDLDQVEPVEVFRSVHQRLRGAPPTPELLGLFQELLEADP